MSGFLTYHWRQYDWLLTIAVVLLATIGLVALYSLALASQTPDWDSLIKQAVALVLGLAAFIGMSFFDYHLWEKYAGWLYGFGMMLLAGVLLFGATIRGTQGWFVLGGFNFQPVEAVKIILIIVLAAYLARRTWPLNQLRHFIGAGLITAGPVILTMLQPDFGSAFLLLLILGSLIVLIGPRRRHWLLFGVLGIVTLMIAWYGIFAPYQKERVMTFLNPSADPLGAGYNVSQSMIAVGAGQWFGRGLGFGSQSQLKFLPAAQTDFMFAVIAEGLGMVGVVLVLGLFTVVIVRLWQTAQRCRDNFGLFLVAGVTCLLFTQVVLNIAVTMGVAPVTGVTLPLISYGGSSLILTLAALGLTQSVRLHS